MFVNLCHFSLSLLRCSVHFFFLCLPKPYFFFTGTTSTTQSNPLTTSTSNSEEGHDICGTSAGNTKKKPNVRIQTLFLRFQVWSLTLMIVMDTTFVYRMVQETGFYTMEIVLSAFISMQKPCFAIGPPKPIVNLLPLLQSRSKPFRNSLAQEVDGSLTV